VERIGERAAVAIAGRAGDVFHHAHRRRMQQLTPKGLRSSSPVVGVERQMAHRHDESGDSAAEEHETPASWRSPGFFRSGPPDRLSREWVTAEGRAIDPAGTIHLQ
jgi:hypothetical protein